MNFGCSCNKKNFCFRYRGNPLDPPLRSRFQARDVHINNFQVINDINYLSCLYLKDFEKRSGNVNFVFFLDILQTIDFRLSIILVTWGLLSVSILPIFSSDISLRLVQILVIPKRIKANQFIFINGGKHRAYTKNKLDKITFVL